jgi:hypothetical protein
MFNIVIIFLIVTIFELSLGHIVETAVEDNSINLIQLGLKLFGKPVEVVKMGDDENFEETGPYLQGDLLIPININDEKRNGMISKSFKWKKGEIPFEIQGTFSK